MCENCKKELNKTFNPKDFEEKIYQNWQEKGYFRAEVDENKKPYTIVIPPPNITNKLHMGHALDNTIQDVLIRTKRMQGYSTLWLPGTDHAAIATEAKIVEQLKKEGTTKEELGREKFLERAWDWKNNYGGQITNQLKKLGSSCDWSRERFTMDEGLSKAVVEVFVRLYEKGLIYKGERMINWCPTCKSTISDEEIEYKEEQGNLWHIRYDAPDKSYSIIVATTRPETMLGDTAIAVHPDDERYKSIVGKTVILPIVNKEIPIVADEYVEKEFGTGAVKITPAHDPNDFEVGLRHDLEVIKVMTDDGKMTDIVEKYAGMDRYEARKAIVEDLEKTGNLIKVEAYMHNVSTCYRCHKPIEPSVSKQWFVKMHDLAQPAIKAVREGKTKFIPERFDKIYFHWMENIKDWCISRQIWWGHRIPAYYCEDCGKMIVARTMPEKCECGCREFIQDLDTLDTWFSAALWPFSTLGWPENTEDLKYFYPTSTLVTGYDIITFWVSKMIFQGIEYMGQVPFENVFVHGLVRDSQGRKMSKSLGNGIDPLEIIDKYGTDALRFSLILNISAGNDIRYSDDKIESASNFCNKIWNASKFVLMNLKNLDCDYVPNTEELCIEDKWIISKLNNLVKDVTTNIENFDIGVALSKIYDFIWNEFCDWYIEMVKPRLYDENCKTRMEAEYTLNKVLQDSLKLLHPYMPFITEEIYTKLINNDESIMISSWPEYDEKLNFEKEQNDIETIKDIITGIRNIRNNMNVHPSKKSKIIFVTKTKKDAIESGKAFIEKLGFAQEVVVFDGNKDIPENAISLTVPEIEIYMPFEDLVDIEAEKQRLNSEKEKYLSEIARVDRMLSNPGFVSKAPAKKIEIRGNVKNCGRKII